MTDASERPFAREDLADLNAFVSSVAARQPEFVYLMPSDIAWRLPGSAPKENLRLWRDAHGLAGCVWFAPPTDIEFVLRDDVGYGADVARAMLEWAQVRRREFAPAYPRFVDIESMQQWADVIVAPRPSRPDDGCWLTVPAFDDDRDRVGLLRAEGFAPTRHFAADYRLDLTAAIAAPSVPAGLRLRHVTDADLDARVACHRAAWLGSSWNLERYRRIRDSPVYDAELDIVLESADGDFVSYCICWTDATTRMASFEPVGTRPEWRGRGIGRAVILEGLRRLRDKGMRTARVGTAGFNAPAQALYESCGFRRTGACRTFMRVVHPG